MAPPPLTRLLITPLSGQSSIYLTPYSARGLSEVISRIPSDGVVRTVNGELVDWTLPQFRKYSLMISCKDQETPALDQAWIGELVEVQCASEFAYRTGGTPERPAVAGSERVEGEFTFYRPELTVRIMDVKTTFAEWLTEYAWQLSALEV